MSYAEWNLGIIDCMVSETVFVGSLEELRLLNNESDEQKAPVIAPADDGSGDESVKKHGKVSSQCRQLDASDSFSV